MSLTNFQYSKKPPVLLIWRIFHGVVVATRNRIGLISLLAATAGFVGMEVMRHLHLLGDSSGWSVLQSGFEAAMVGGMADWFAVSALFRPIPCRRLALPHTDIIVRSRRKLSAGIVDMVQNRWLSPSVMAEHLGRLSVCRLILEHLEPPAARRKILDAAQELLGRLVGSLDTPEIAAFLDRAFRDQLAGLELGPALGRFLTARVREGSTQALWDTLAASLARGAEHGDFRQPIRRMLESAVTHYKEQGFLARIKGTASEWLFDYDEVSESLSKALAEQLHDIERDPHHPLRVKLDEQLLVFAQKLAEGDREACASLERLQQRLVDHAELGPLLSHILSRLQQTLREQLSAPQTPLDRLLERLLDGLIASLRAEPLTQERLDGWVRASILDLVHRHHGVIGEMVAGALEKLSDQDLVNQIEEKVGADLQYIRLNGAVVGSLVGMALALVKLAWASQ